MRSCRMRFTSGKRYGRTCAVPRGAWWVFWDDRRLPGQPRRKRSKKVGDKPTALVVARRIREALVLGSLNIPTESESFSTYGARWLTGGAAGRKASTQRFYKFNLELHLNPLLGSVPIASVTRAHGRQVIASCRDKGLKLASLYGVQRTLSAILTQAVEDGLLTANPCQRMGRYLRPADEERPAINPLTQVEAHQFLTVVETHWPDYYAFFLTALRTGLRLGELLALQWGDRFREPLRARATQPRRRASDDAEEFEAAEGGLVRTLGGDARAPSNDRQDGGPEGRRWGARMGV